MCFTSWRTCPSTCLGKVLPADARARLEFTPAPKTYFWQEWERQYLADRALLAHVLQLHVQQSILRRLCPDTLSVLLRYDILLPDGHYLHWTCIRSLLAFHSLLVALIASYLHLHCILRCQQLGLPQYFCSRLVRLVYWSYFPIRTALVLRSTCAASFLTSTPTSCT